MVGSADARRLIARWRHDPVQFARDVLGITPWDRQADLLRAVAMHDRVVCRSGHKTGKSTSAAVLALWFVVTRPDGRVVMTSASARQVEGILWREVRKLHGRARVPIGGDLAISPEKGLRFEDGREVVGFSTNEPERMAGLSGQNLLFVIDEASGVPEEIFEAIEGNRAGGSAKILLLSNPTRTSGTFFDAFGRNAKFWHPIRISSEDTPNVREGRVVVPGLATRDWVEEKRAEWGEDSLLYAVRVRGEFPSQDAKSLIALSLVTDAKARYDVTPAEGPLVVGVDPARFGGDSSVIAPLRGHKALSLRSVDKSDGPTVAGKVMEAVRSLRVPGERVRVQVDVIGIGASVYDALKVYESEIEVVAVDAGAASNVVIEGRPAFGCLRDELWCGLRDWLKAGGAIPNDPQLEGELVGTQYGYDMRGRIKVESKDSMRKRLKRSPDRADALALAVHLPRMPVPWEPITFGTSRWGH